MMPPDLLAAAPAWLLAAIVCAVLMAIGAAIWAALPRRRTLADIDRQIATLRRSADHAVATRPRVRATSTPANQPGIPPKPCGGGLCRHRADCTDTHCPGRLAATLAGTEARHARR